MLLVVSQKGISTAGLPGAHVRIVGIGGIGIVGGGVGGDVLSKHRPDP